MVQIPIFEKKLSEKKIPGLVSRVNNPTAAAVGPLNELSRQASNLTGLATKAYSNKKNFENQQLQDKLNFENQELKVKLNKSNKLDEIKNKNKADVYRANEAFATQVKQIETDSEIKFYEAATRLERKNNITLASNNLELESNDITISYSTSSTLSDIPKWLEEQTKLKDKHKNTLQTKVERDIFEENWNNYITNESLKIKKSIRTNLLEVSKVTYQNEIDKFAYKAIFGSTTKEKEDALNYLLSEDGIILEMDKSGLVLNKEIQIAAIRNKIGFYDAEKKLQDNPQLLLSELESDQYAEILTTDQVLDFRQKAKLKIDKEIRATNTSLKASSTAIRGFLNDEEKLLKNLSRANLPQLNQLLEEAKGLTIPGTEDYFDPTLVQDIENMISLVDVVDTFRSYNKEEGAEAISLLKQSLNEKLDDDDNTTGIAPIEQLQLEIFEKIQTDKNTRIPNDMLRVALDYGVIDNIPQIDFNLASSEPEVFKEQVNALIKQAEFVAEYYDEPIQFFTKEQISNFNQIVTNAQGPDEIVEFASAIHSTFDTHSLSAFKQIHDKAPILAEIGGHVSNGNSEFAMHIANGMMLKKDQKLMPNLVNNQDFGKIFIDVIGDSLNDNTQTLLTKQTAIENVIISRGIAEGWYDTQMDVKSMLRKTDFKNKINQIINESIGATYNGDKLIYGGMITFNGKQIALPTNFPRTEIETEKDFKNLIEDTFLSDDVNQQEIATQLIIKAGGGISLPTTTPYVDTENRQEMSVTPDKLFGKNSDPYYLEQIAPGKYVFAIFDQQDGNPDHEYLMYEGSNEPFVFDLGKITEDLIK